MTEVWADAEKLSEKAPRNIDELCQQIEAFFPNADLEFIRKAFVFSEKAHSGQWRRSGEPYISHPLGVAGILADLHLDLASIATGLLHDTVEDTEVTLEDIEQEFGPVICNLVDGVTKISLMTFRNTHEKQGENVRKMIVAMGKDVRVILVKLCDRLHNMRTLNSMPPQKQMRIAHETLDIYAPLASRLGISQLKVELEDLSFRYANPEAYYSLAQKVSKKKKERERYIDEVKRVLRDELSGNNFKGYIQGRPKHLYSIYRKMVHRGIDYEQVYDVLAFRIIVQSVTQCYEVLGVVHSLWKPIPGRFKDFIAMPKANNYQSLHTTVIGLGGERIEIQIRTEGMHLIAERGIAAHWKYKENDQVDPFTEEKFRSLRELISWHQQGTEPGEEFLEGIKSDLFESEIYVFTPKGEVKEFPEGATPIDFAYSIHTDVGNQCVAARVNGRLVPLKTTLKNGDTVEIVTSPQQTPSKDWLKFCVTNRAKSKVRWHIRSEQRKKAEELGIELVDKAFRKSGFSAQKHLKGKSLEDYLSRHNLKSLEELYVQVGYGKVVPKELVSDILGDELDKRTDENSEEPGFLEKVFQSAIHKKKNGKSSIAVDGMTDVLVRFAKCCDPIPGDPIVGYITRGRGITVHRADCPKSFEMDQIRRVEVMWTDNASAMSRLAKVQVVCHDIPGLLKSMSETFAAKGVNVHNAQIRTTKDKKAVCQFDVSVRDTQHLTELIVNMQKIKGIIGVNRITS